MSHDLRTYGLYAAAQGSVCYSMGLLFATFLPPVMGILPILGGVHGVSRTVTYGMSHLLAPENRGSRQQLTLIKASLASLVAFTCMWVVAQAIGRPIPFTAAIMLGLGFELFGGALTRLAIPLWAFVLVKLGMINADAVPHLIHCKVGDSGSRMTQLVLERIDQA